LTNQQIETIRILKSEGEENNSILGIILCGSLVNGTSTEQSDVDVYIVVNEDEWKKRKRNKDYFWGTLHDQDHYPTPVDGKVVNLDFINKISKTGTEAIQSTFENVELIYCNDAKLSEAIQNISKNHLIDRTEKINKYFALMKSNRFRADDDLTNIFQVKQCIIDTVYFACRIIITKNNLLFPCKKNIEKILRNCINKPDCFIEQMNETLESQSLESLARFYLMMEKYLDDLKLDERSRKGYVIENELFWFFNEKPYEEI
jgi:predicted nucleotidyltransferase